MKNSLVASFFYFLLCTFFIAGTFLPIKAFLLCFIYFGYSWLIRFFYKKNERKDVEAKDFIAAGMFTLLVLFLHIWTGGQIEIVQVIILFCINCIASVNFGALLRYEILT